MSSLPQSLGTPLLHEDFLPTPSPTIISTLCPICHNPSPHNHCSTRKSTHYCSPTCQTLDWPLHNLICRAYTASLTRRPTPQHRLALSFPIQGTKPGFIYVEFGDDGTPLDIMQYFGGTEPGERRTVAFHNRYLPCFTQISYDGNPRGSRFLPVNESIGGEAFRGAVVVLSFDPEVGLGGGAVDVDPGVVGAVREYAELRGSYEGAVFVEQPQKRYAEKEWDGIVEAARKRYGEGEWEKIMGTVGPGV